MLREHLVKPIRGPQPTVHSPQSIWDLTLRRKGYAEVRRVTETLRERMRCIHEFSLRVAAKLCVFALRFGSSQAVGLVDCGLRTAIALTSAIFYFRRMQCIVTAGPTYETLDNVRRLTNFSTGRLGCELATFLSSRGHEVTLLIGQQATYCGERHAARIETFSTTTDLRDRLRKLSAGSVAAVFHAAGVSDFAFGKVWLRSPGGELSEIRSGKISTRQGTLLAELVPMRKIIAELRDWFLKARLVGWKYEVDGDRAQVLGLAKEQVLQCRTDACVANGPAYGAGFGLVSSSGGCTHLRDMKELFDALEAFLQQTILKDAL